MCPDCCGGTKSHSGERCDCWYSQDGIYVGDLSPKHRKALELFVEKFRKGAAEHGDLPVNKNWTKEALDELCDYGFYMIFALLSKTDADKSL